MTASMPKRYTIRGGMTLIEATISLVIVAVLIVMGLNTLGSAARTRRIVTSQYAGATLARQLISEILQAYYREPTDAPVSGLESLSRSGSRGNFDDVDDYDGWSASPPQAKDGQTIANGAGWRRSVSVAYADPDQPTATAGEDLGLKRITVTATDPRGIQTVATALRSSKSIYDQRPDQQTTYVTYIDVELQVGGDGVDRIQAGTNILKKVPAKESVELPLPVSPIDLEVR